MQEIARLLAQIAAAEKIAIDEPALIEIARHSEGGFRDAIGTLEKLATFFSGEEVTSREVLDLLGVIETDLLFEIVDIVIDRDAAGALLFVQRIAERGVSYPQFITDLLRQLRQLFLLQHLEEVSEDAVALRALAQNLEIDEQLIDRLVQQANQLAPRELLHFVDLLGRAQTEIKAGLDARLQLELALVRIARPALDHSDEALEERLRRLEAGSVPMPARQAPAAVAAGAQRSARAATSRDEEAVPSSPATEAAAPSATTPAAETAAPTTPATPAAEAAAPSAAAPAAPEAPDGELPAAAALAKSGDVEEAPARAAVADNDAAPASPAAPAPAASGGDAPAPRTQRAWDIVLEGLRRQDDTLYAFLRDARVRATSDTVLTVPVASNLGLSKVSEPSARELIAAIIDKTVGGAPELQFVYEGDRAAPAASGGARQPAASGDAGPDGAASGSEQDVGHSTERAQTPTDIGLSTAQAIQTIITEFNAVELSDDE